MDVNAVYSQTDKSCVRFKRNRAHFGYARQRPITLQVEVWLADKSQCDEAKHHSATQGELMFTQIQTTDWKHIVFYHQSS